MKKIIMTVFLMSSVISANALGHDDDVALIAGLAGLALIIGDGRSSFGIHYDRGYYNYRGYRYNNRAAYLRAISQYERERRYYSGYGYSNSRYYNNSRYYGNSYYYGNSSRSRYNDSDRNRKDVRIIRSARDNVDRSNDRDNSRESSRRSSRN